ncbi:hypothetical protein [Dyella tabacisoli]|uniref:Phage baseplate protein n=1 Tax=Dyella tabacisoli TaxID=2282381 RepID=A0A369UNB2_9GAMM|nr:hypothetical protein [Dyella tabacisoli]RDD82126.1 hypothetical protein DVJ77_08690 [Dyella tabacisoli]
MNAADLLAIWERGRLLPPLRRARLLCALDSTDAPADAPPDRLPIGATNARLLNLRRSLFGPDIAGIADCPACDTRLEIAMQVEDFLAAWNSEETLRRAHSIEIEGHPLHFRLPTLEDLEAMDANLDAQQAQEQLLLLCLSEPDRTPTPRAVEPLLAEMARVDPLADPQLALSCHACGHGFTLAFDIAAFLWLEIEAWGARLLTDVHTIARAYGWSETDILALPPTRRQAYLDLICA